MTQKSVSHQISHSDSLNLINPHKRLILCEFVEFSHGTRDGGGTYRLRKTPLRMGGSEFVRPGAGDSGAPF